MLLITTMRIIVISSLTGTVIQVDDSDNWYDKYTGNAKGRADNNNDAASHKYAVNDDNEGEQTNTN